MKIKGTDGVGPGAPPEPEELDGGGSVDGAGFEEAMAAGAEEAGAAQAALPLGNLAELGRMVEAGQISGAGAAEALVDSVVNDQIHLLGPERAELLRAELLRLLEEDPALSQQLKKLS